MKNEPGPFYTFETHTDMYNKINAVQAKGIGLDLFKWGKSAHV